MSDSDRPLSEFQLKMFAYNYLVGHIFEYGEKLELTTVETVRREYHHRIEVYEYLIKLLGGDAKDD